ncbi:TetR/AcrR family transcriptional regulator [Polycladidibacter stylochi]|uniref:TetR/AcrR family transcriptional regulator n=1 Tax=Polycladidibacter stylochi TaxID=1807766 RepID=UPI00082C9A38|nr:TetR/AcrR family transcriptional regulator [Pseudovibrio stylochi]
MSERSEPGTRERLLESAEKLLSQFGLSGTSVRMITEKAGANVAAVNYHFGSKEDLVRAVLMGHLRELDDMRMQRMDALEAGGRKPDVEEICRAFVEPMVVHGISRETGDLVPFVVLIRQIFSDPEMGQKILAGWEPSPVLVRLTNSLVEAMGVTPLSSQQSHLLVMLMHSATLEAIYVMTGAKLMHPADNEEQEQLLDKSIEYIAGGVRSFLSGPQLKVA